MPDPRPLADHVLENLAGRARSDLSSVNANQAVSTRIPARMLLALVNEVQAARNVDTYPKEVVTITIASREATLAYPDGKQVRLGETEAAYHELVAIIDAKHEKD